MHSSLFTWLRRELSATAFATWTKQRSAHLISRLQARRQEECCPGEVNTQHALEPQHRNRDTPSIKGSPVDDEPFPEKTPPMMSTFVAWPRSWAGANLSSTW